jgi:hypothetical protein
MAIPYFLHGNIGEAGTHLRKAARPLSPTAHPPDRGARGCQGRRGEADVLFARTATLKAL